MRDDLRNRVRDAAPTPRFDADDVRDRATRRQRLRRNSTVIVALAIAVGGVGGLFLSGFGRPDRTLPAAGIDGVIHQANLPITDAGGWSVDQQWTMHEAESLLQSACMRRAEFELPRVPFDASTGVDRRYGLKNLEAARKWGFGLPPAPPDPTDAYVGSLSPEEQRRFGRAYLGAPDGAEAIGTGSATGSVGCADEARNAIYGSATSSARAEVLRQMFEGLGVEAYFASEEDWRVHLVKDRWIDCMEGRGYDVSSLNDPMDASVLLDAGTDEGDPEDIELATSFVRCSDATDLVEIWSGVEAGIQAALLEEHRTEMEEFLALRSQAVENAERIVHEGPGSAP